MRKGILQGTLAIAAMLALGGVAYANDPAMENTDTTTTDTEKQSGVEEKGHEFDVKQLKGQQAIKLQESLKSQGLYHGKIDGQIGPLTMEALRKFQEQKGFEASGKLDQQTAAALGLDSSDIQPVSGSDSETSTETNTNTDTGTSTDSETSTDPQSGMDSEEPTASPTPMTNSGSTTTEPDSGIDKAGQAGESGTASPEEDKGELEPQSGDETTSDELDPVSGEDVSEEPVASPTPGSIEDDASLPETETDPADDVDTQSGEASDNATGTGSMNTGAGEDTSTATETDTQSGADTGIDSTDDSTSPVTGGDTSTEDTEPTSGDSTGGETMGSEGEGVSTDDDPNVVNESEIEPQAGTSSTFDKKTIKEVEVALKQKKLFNGKVDGVLDAKTEQAIRAFQSQQGFNVTGRLDTQTLSALGVKSDVKLDGETGVNKNTNIDSNTNSNTNTDPGMTTPAPNETPMPTPVQPTDPANPGTMSPQ